MKTRITLIALAAMLVASAPESRAQTRATQTYYSFSWDRVLPINWKPEYKERQQYTIAVDFLHFFNSGLKVDFQYQLPNPSEWLQIGLMGYLAPERRHSGSRDYGNYSSYWYDETPGWKTFNSSFDFYKSMWGLGVSTLFKKMVSMRGWYFSTGLMFQYYNVSRNEYGLFSYREDGLTFYREGVKRVRYNFYKPSVQFNFGKHFNLSRRMYFDLFVGLAYSHAFTDFNPGDSDYYTYRTIFGFGYRGISPNLGFKLGVLLWDRDKGDKKD